MTANRDRRGRALIAIAASLLMCAALPLWSAADDTVEAGAKRARGGGGVRAGDWQVHGLEAPANGSDSETITVEGWFQKGLDLHLAMESTLGFWQRTQNSTQSGSLGTESRHETNTYLVPTLTTLKMYPLTRPANPLEPFLAAGVGVVLGIDQEKVTSTDPLVPSGTGTTFHSGLGISTGVGMDCNTGSPFGLTIGGRYQWATFGEKVGGAALYRGFVANAGLTYRFQC
jgi:opacity protein-like surface antigen